MTWQKGHLWWHWAYDGEEGLLSIAKHAQETAMGKYTPSLSHNVSKETTYMSIYPSVEDHSDKFNFYFMQSVNDNLC